MSDEPLVTADEAAAYLSIDRDTVYKWVSKKDLPHYKLGSALRFRKSELDAWVVQRRRGQPVDTHTPSGDTPSIRPKSERV